MSESYYDVLEVSPDASEETIKEAYQKKVKEHHPDQSDDPDAQEKFRRVREAKETLLDKQARRRYDRRQQREASKDDEQGGSGESSESSEEWAREQRRRERQQQRERQQRRRQQRNQRRERQQRRRRGEQSNAGSSGTDGRSRERAGRQTETRTREREATSSREREQHANRSVGARIRNGISWLRDLRHRPRRWVLTQIHSRESVLELLTDLSQSPTAIRLVAAIAMIVTAMQVIPASARSSTIRFGIVLGGLALSYGAYAVFSPLPFEEPRSRERFKPAGRAPIWPAVAMNLLALGTFGLAAVNNVSAAGIGFTMAAGLYSAMTILAISLVFTVIILLISGIFSTRLAISRSVKYGVLASPIGAFLLMFTRYGAQYGDGATLHNELPTIVDQVNTAPWIPHFTLGPVYMGSFLNYLISLVIIGCLFGSVFTMCRYLTVVPWSDRYEHGYRVRPSIWNFVVAAPFVVLGWMVFAGVSNVSIGSIQLWQSTLWVMIFLLPTILAGAYIIRRQIEPRLQERLWETA